MCNGSGDCAPDCRTAAEDYFAHRPDVSTAYAGDLSIALWHWCTHGHNMDQRDNYPCRCYVDSQCTAAGYSFYSAHCP